MLPESAKSIADMQRAVERIERFTAGKTYENYVQDELLRSAVERQFEIIGEAMTRLMRTDAATVHRISEFRKIAGFRNALIHGYDAIDDEISWGVITTKLSVLKKELEQLAAE